MDTDAYLLVRHQIQDRLAAQRVLLSPELGLRASPISPFAWLPIAAHWVFRFTGWNTLVSSVVTAGIGYGLSRLKKHAGLDRFIPALLKTIS